MHSPIPTAIEEIGARLLDAAFAVHRNLGPGLLESVYEACVCHELTKARVPFQRQLAIPIDYEGMRIDGGLRIDVLVADEVIAELKAVEAIAPVHEAQLLTYLKLTRKRLGFIINFNVPMLKAGIQRIVL